MRNNTIVDKLQRSLSDPRFGKGGIHPLPFVYADQEIQNITLDAVEPPFVAVVPLSSGMANDEHGLYYDQVTLAVFFGDVMAQAMGDYDAVENERTIDDCKRRAFMWLYSLNSNRELQLISVNGAERWYLEGDQVTTGYVVNVTLKELEGYGACDMRS